MTREDMIHILLSEQRDDISADIERSAIADRLKADGETIERLEADLHNCEAQRAKFVATEEKRSAIPKRGLHLAGHMLIDDPATIEAVGTTFEQLTASRDAALARVAVLEEALRPFTEIPARGIFGGPLCCIKGVYEDGSDTHEYGPPDKSVLGHEACRRAREALKGSSS